MQNSKAELINNCARIFLLFRLDRHSSFMSLFYVEHIFNNDGIPY